jgi:hypothetical protein
LGLQYALVCTQVLQYLDSYAEHFNLGSLVTLGHAVEKIEPAPGGGYVVSTLRLSTGVSVFVSRVDCSICGQVWAGREEEV